MKLPKALMIAPFAFFPSQSGGELAMANHFKALASSFDLTLLVPNPQDPHHQEGIRVLKQKARVVCVPPSSNKPFFDSNMFEKIPILCRRFFAQFPIGNFYEFYVHEITLKLLEEDFDLIQVEHSWWYHPILRSHRAKLVVMEHNYEYEYFSQFSKAHFKQKKIFEGLIFLEVARRIRLQELLAVKDADLVLTLSDRITNQIKKASGSKRVFTGAHGLNRETYESYLVSSLQQNSTSLLRIIYVGALDVFQTAEAALFFIQEIYPFLKRSQSHQFEFYLVGRNPITELVNEANKDQSIIVTGFVPDIRELISQADIYVVPLRYGSGIRFKIMEAMMMGKPIVSTSKGVEGLFADKVPGVIVADEPQYFADVILRLSEDKNWRISLGEQNRIYAFEHFDFEKNFMAKTLPYYQQLLS